eukprot:c956_g1_i1.p1 GENE.c956_g1_i1~~c956_g1_i1.p1  ORF type:complete len:631 (-),score=122.73 c956_g1_i1:33-1925(-)
MGKRRSKRPSQSNLLTKPDPQPHKPHEPPSKVLWQRPRRRVAFVLGCLLGLCVAIATVPFWVPILRAAGISDNVTDLLALSHMHLQSRVNIALPNFTRISPQNFLTEFQASLPQNVLDQLNDMMDFLPAGQEVPIRPGARMSAEGFSKKHPVLMIPGIVTTGLELWEGEPCAASLFRQRIWGTMNMVRQFLTNRECWINHMGLNTTTGMDKLNIKLRAARGLEAADYVVGGYWVWAKLIENLADIGYDSNHMSLLGYDWRLSHRNLERRDRYFTKMVREIEGLTADMHEKVVVVTHSMGFNVWHYFTRWIEATVPGWVARHVHALVNIAGPTLGTPSAVTRLLTGHITDLQQLGLLGTLLDMYFAPAERRHLFQSWGSVLNLFPVGGEIVWGHNDAAMGHSCVTNESLGEECPPWLKGGLVFANRSAKIPMEEVHKLLMNDTECDYIQIYKDEYSFGFGVSDSFDSSKWNNVLESPLPLAPNMTIYCLYGTGKSAERGAFLVSQSPPFRMDTEFHNPEYGVSGGMFSGDGDGTVPLVSLGFMCVEGWRHREFNPSNLPVVTREYKHRPTTTIDSRGGPETAEHVDILGNEELIQNVLQVAAGHTIDNRVESPIRNIADKIKAEMLKRKHA